MYLFVLVIIFILKLVGLDYFGIALDNPIMIKFESLFSNSYVRAYFNVMFLVVYQYLMLSAVCEDNSKKFKILTIITIPATHLVQIIKYKLLNYSLITLVLELVY